MVEKNRWACTRYEFCSWNVGLYQGKDNKYVFADKLLNFMEEVLASGEKHNIVSIKQSALPNKGIPQLAYIDQIKWSIENKHELPFFGGLTRKQNSDDTIIKSGTVCLFDQDGQVKEITTNNLVDLIKHRKTFSDFSPHLHGIVAISPVELYSGSIVSLNNTVYNTDYVTLHIQLFSDIWFPRVLDLMNLDVGTLWREATFIDNSELANCHTPRLNQFLQEVRKLTLDYGGKWEFYIQDGGGIGLYEDMVDDSGIILNSQ